VSFNAMLARLGRSSADRERALAATRRFAADAGHELRTPLTSVLATLSSLRRHPELDDQRRAAMLDDALTEHRRLVVLVDGLQAMARGDASTAPDGEMDLAELAGAAVEAAAARHPGCEVTAALPPAPVRVRGWEPGLRLVLDNLLENAARHGGGRPPVRLTLEPPRDGDGPVLHVDDGGPGVPAGDRERVFEPFVRLQAAQHPGSGLGLALVAQQVRHHGGTVTAGDSPLGGARFTVRLPPAG
jgi:two-component system, OmpR family, sensor histidine kinase PrrB